MVSKLKKQQLPAFKITRILLVVGLLASLGFSFTSVQSASTASYTVSKTADTNDGACDADCSLREAILAANQNSAVDTVSIPAGTYTLSISGKEENHGATGDLDILNDLILNGAGSGSTIISANSIDRAIEITETATVTITGVTIQNGLLPEKEVGGGGILNHGDLQLTNSTIESNYAVRGAGVFNSLGNLSINECIIQTNGDGNTSEGGGIYSDGEITVSSSEIRDNIAKTGAGLSGTERANVELNDVLFDGNVASLYGGAIFNDKAVKLSDVTLSNNQALWGGGLYNNYIANLERVTINNNSAQVGAGIHNSEGTLKLGSVTISTNTASLEGGGIYNNGFLELKNVTLTKNRSPLGAGLLITDEGSVTFSNSILAENTLMDGSTKNNCINEGGFLTSAGYNIEDSSSCQLGASGDLPNTNPNLLPLDDYGGLTKTHSPNYGSPAIDAGFTGDPGNGNDPSSCTLVAQNRVIRPADGDLNGSIICDIGAVEKYVNGLFGFSPTTFVSEETSTTITFTVTRRNSDEAVSVRYLSPQNIGDIIPVSGTLSWGIGDTSPKTFTVTIIDDIYKEGDEVIKFILYNPTNGAGIEYPYHEAFLTILENDPDGPPEKLPPHLPLIIR
jgi:CSLREA domain-containing protein